MICRSPWLALLGLMLVGCATPRAVEEVKSPSGPIGKLAAGQPCPAFLYETLDGAKVSLDDYKGKYVAILVTSYT